MKQRAYYLLGFVFALALALFWHFRQENGPLLHLNEISEQFVVADQDFLYPDEDATAMMQDRSMRDVGVIYRFDPEGIKQVTLDLLNEDHWRDKLQQTTYEEVFEQVNLVEKTLLNVRFTDARTLQKIKDLAINPASFFLALPKEDRFWEEMNNKALVTGGDTSRFILSYFQNYNWKLLEDKAKKRTIWRLIKAKVPKQFVRVRSGTRLISPGEKVNARHIAMFKAMNDSKDRNRPIKDPYKILGSLILGMSMSMLGAAYMKLRHFELSRSASRIVLMVVLLLLTFGLAKVVESFALPMVKITYPFFTPFLAILICILVNFEMALFVSVFATVFLGMTLPLDPKTFILLNLVASFFAATGARRIHRRRQIFTLCGKAYLSCVPLILVFALAKGSFGELSTLIDLALPAGFFFFTAILTVALLPPLESLFRVTSDMSLMEYMDPDSDLLRRLSVEAPCTYQHSLIVGHLAEAAARAIRANDLFCRVASLYHDIGKLINPHYFTENQLGGFNVHPLLTPPESAQVIIAHVTEGEALAKKKHLLPPIIDIIREHHGTTLVSYFYCKQVELMNGDKQAVDATFFRYPGPKPHTKESAIIMIADSVEAASRCLDVFSLEKIEEMINRLVAEKAQDGQFDECQLTFEELGIVKQAMAKALLVSHHMRIKYPNRV